MNNRVEIATNIVKEAFENDEKLGNVLLVENYDIKLFNFFSKRSSKLSVWNRFFSTKLPSKIFPENSVFDTVVIRLPKSHASFDMILNIVSGLLIKDARIIVYGMTDEGIKGAKKKMRIFFDNVETVLFKKRCHVLMSRIKSKFDEKNIQDFKVNTELLYDDSNLNMEFYPGMFASGKLDIGTKVLLDSLLPLINNKQSILDYGCGSGIIGVIAKKYFSDIEYTGLDIDLISLFAAKKNMPSAQFIASDSMNFDEMIRYDIIVSNPPMHTEKIEHTKIIEHLIESSPRSLKKKGKFIIVVQSRLKLEKLFTKYFKNYQIIKNTNQFSVYVGSN